MERDTFLALLSNHPIYKKFLVENASKQYDDELRIFLVHCLRKVDYLSSMKEDILTHIAMHMIAY